MSEESGSYETESKTINTASVQDIVRAVADCKGHYSFLIGAGTSQPAGIKTANNLVKEWQTQRYSEEHSDNSENITEEEIRDWAESYEQSESHPEEDSYGFWFEQRHTTRGERRRLIRKKVEDKEPTFGIIVLASLMEQEYIPLTLTTNFDDLLYDALYRFLETKPLAIDHNAVAAEFRLTKARPTIIKLHGDYLYDNLQNTATEKEALQNNMARALSLTLNEYGLIVIGYGGTDKSIMDEVLLDDLEIPEYGVYWCVRDTSELSNKAKIFLQKDNTFLVEIDGSESFFTKLGNRIADVDPPTKEDIQENADRKKKKIDQTIEQRSQEANTDEEEEYTDVLSYLSQAQQHRMSGEWKEAIRYSEKAINTKSDNGPASAYAIRGHARTEMGDQSEAVEDYTTAIELDPEQADTYDNRGTAYKQIGEYERAIEDHSKAIEINPDNSNAYNNRGNSYHRIGEYKRAIEDRTKAIDINPKNVRAYLNRSETRLCIELYEKSFKDAKEGYELANETELKAVGLMLAQIAKIMQGEEMPELEREYQQVCSEEFESSMWRFEELNSFLEANDFNRENEKRIREIIALLRNHKSK